MVNLLLRLVALKLANVVRLNTNRTSIYISASTAICQSASVNAVPSVAKEYASVASIVVTIVRAAAPVRFHALPAANSSGRVCGMKTLV